MKLVPSSPPGRSTRRARGFASEMRALRAQGYTFEAIRQALAAVGVHVSNATVQREVARAAKSPVAEVDGALPRRSLHGQISAEPAAPVDTRSAKEVAQAFASRQITNPLVRAKHLRKDLE